jgi:hypothetical protein
VMLICVSALLMKNFDRAIISSCVCERGNDGETGIKL